MRRIHKNATCQYFFLAVCLVLCGVMVVLGGKPNNTPANDPSLIQRINSKNLGWKAKAHKIFEGKTLGELKKMFVVDPSVMAHFKDAIDMINQQAKEKEANRVGNNNNNNGISSNVSKKKGDSIKIRKTKGNNKNPGKKTNPSSTKKSTAFKKTKSNKKSMKVIPQKTSSPPKRSKPATKTKVRSPTNRRKVTTTVKASKKANKRTLRISSGGASTLAADGSGIPESFDARTKWPNCKPQIRHQLECGSCYAFTSTGALAHRFCVASRGKVYPNLAPDYLVRCNSETKACKGGKTTSAWDFLEKTGVPTSECVKYRSGHWNVQACPDVCDDGATPLKMYKTKPGSFKQLQGEMEIKRSIMNEGSVHTIMIALRDFLTYESGIYTRNSDTLVGIHAVQLIGWGKEKGESYWIGVNSWGETWGLNGYFKIRMGEVAIGGQTHAALPQL